jgi:molybdopterin molybdotransferase
MGRDTLTSLTRKVRRGLAWDLLVISGGVSVGEKDLVRKAAQRCGVRPLLWQVNIKPGMPLFFGKRGRTLVFGLPGNPVSVFVTFEEFVKPALCTLMGRARHDGYTHPATLAEDLKISRTRRTHFIRVRCVSDNGQMQVAPIHGQGSHHLHSLIKADGWIRMNADGGPWPAGTHVFVKRESPRW